MWFHALVKNYVPPEIKDESEKSFEKALIDFNNILGYLDNSHIKKVCGDIASEVVKNGAYYGYISPSKDGLVLQQLPINYCRTRFNIGDMPVIEFDMRYRFVIIQSDNPRGNRYSHGVYINWNGGWL